MRYLPTRYQHVYVTGAGHFLPGNPVHNDEIDDYIAPINKQSSRIKRRILNENGIKSRHYAIDKNGNTTYSATQMAAYAVAAATQNSGHHIDDITLLATGSGGGDVLMPGFANMLQGELKAPPMETRSHHGICAAGVHALKDAANLVENKSHKHALVTALEFPSRLFKKSRFSPMNYNIDFDAHFLRWMLSDGAGAIVLSDNPGSQNNITLKLDWIHSKSFSGDFPVCMQIGRLDEGSTSYLDAASFAQAEQQGLLALRQDIRLLPQLFEVGIHEYSELVKREYISPDEVDHFLCHYSSSSLGAEAHALMTQAGLEIAQEKCFSNLEHCGNTGSASIFIMLSDFIQQKQPQPGEKIFCFVPESGRFTVSYFMFTVVEKNKHQKIEPPHNPANAKDKSVQHLLQELASIWHEYRSNVWRTPLVTRILNGQLTLADYRNWMSSWIPQVREGSKWMRTAISNLPEELSELKTLVEQHASDGQDDYMILFDDYQAAGGEVSHLDDLKRNPGGDALNAYMYSVAQSQNPVGLLGGIYIIEGTGQRIIPALLPRLRQQLALTDRGFRFLRYHGENDIHHLQRWLKAISIAGSRYSDEILRTARHVAQLYQLQWEYVL